MMLKNVGHSKILYERIDVFVTSVVFGIIKRIYDDENGEMFFRR